MPQSQAAYRDVSEWLWLPVARMTFRKGKKWLNLTDGRRGSLAAYQSDPVYNGTEIMLAARPEARNSPFYAPRGVLQYFLPSSFAKFYSI